MKEVWLADRAAGDTKSIKERRIIASTATFNRMGLELEAPDKGVPVPGPK